MAWLSVSAKQEQNNHPGVACTLSDLITEGLKSGQLNLSRLSLRTTTLSGSKTSRLHGRGMDFHEVRRYVYGDEKRNIDWRVSARLGVLHTKIFVEEKELPIFVVVDQRPHLFFGSQKCLKSAMAAQIAAKLAFSAIANNDKLGGCIFSKNRLMELKPKTGQMGLTRFLGALEKANQELLTTAFSSSMDEGGYTASTVLRHISQVCHPGSLIFLISDFQGFNEECRHALGKLRKKNDVVAFFLFDKLEQELPKSGRLGFEYGGTNVQVDASNARVQKNYKESFSAHMNYIKQLFSAQAIPLFAIATHENVDLTLERIFASRPRTTKKAL